ncbi:MAG TPA: hypothetical protein VF914_15395 [Chloroflexia bacterium]
MSKQIVTKATDFVPGSVHWGLRFNQSDFCDSIAHEPRSRPTFDVPPMYVARPHRVSRKRHVIAGMPGEQRQP